jgi:hypothetical protein
MKLSDRVVQPALSERPDPFMVRTEVPINVWSMRALPADYSNGKEVRYPVNSFGSFFINVS